MNIPEQKVKRLVELADIAISAALKEKEAAISAGKQPLAEDCEMVISNFKSIKAQALSGSLGPSNGARLGITRALGEWEVSDRLFLAGSRLEDFFADEYHA